MCLAFGGLTFSISTRRKKRSMPSRLSSEPATRTSEATLLLAWLAGPMLAPDEDDWLSLCSASSAADADADTDADTDTDADAEADGARFGTSVASIVSTVCAVDAVS